MCVAVMKDHGPIISLLSYGKIMSRGPPLQDNMDETAESPTVARPIGRWFQ